MVSFQCDGCSDVVKKPKLEQHRIRCNASFTCIDCSKTFPSPADWKSHTSCISEAEKYQKSLYKPKKNHDREQSTKFQFQGRDRKFRNNSNASWNKGFSRSQATGANGTPLGTPVRMSPVTTTENEAKPSTPNNISQGAETSVSSISHQKKRKADEISPGRPSDGVKEEIKSSKKRKSDTKNLDDAMADADTGALREVTSEDKADDVKEKKKKNIKLDETNQNTTDDLNPENGFTKVKDKKDKKVSRKKEITGTNVRSEDKDDQRKKDVTIEESQKGKNKRKSIKKAKSEENGDERLELGEVSSTTEKRKRKERSDEGNRDDIETKNMDTEKESSRQKERGKRNKKKEHTEKNEAELMRKRTRE